MYMVYGLCMVYVLASCLLHEADSLGSCHHELLLLCMPPPGERNCADQALQSFKGRGLDGWPLDPVSIGLRSLKHHAAI